MTETELDLTEEVNHTEPDKAEEAAVPIEGTPQQRDDAGQRRVDCYEAIQQALARHRCRIATGLFQEPVGPEPIAKVLTTATWDVYPEVVGE